MGLRNKTFKGERLCLLLSLGTDLFSPGSGLLAGQVPGQHPGRHPHLCTRGRGPVRGDHQPSCLNFGNTFDFDLLLVVHCRGGQGVWVALPHMLGSLLLDGWGYSGVDDEIVACLLNYIVNAQITLNFTLLIKPEMD